MPNKTFDQRIELQVPARSPIGPSPSRGQTFVVEVPAAYEIIRSGPDGGATITNVNFGGLTERRCDIEQTPNGIKLTWKLANGEVFPVGGRSAFMEIQLLGKSVEAMTFLDRYGKLRDRFFAEFYFDGRVAVGSDSAQAGGNIQFGDQTIYLGFALMAMASEYAIHRSIGSDASDSLAKTKRLLDAITINELDFAAEPYVGSA